MKNTFGRAVNGVGEPHKRESHIGRISTTGNGGKSLTVTNMNNSELRNLVPIMPYGISSSPPIGLMAFVLVANNSGRDGIIGTYDPNKPSCGSGDSMLYSSGGATVHCRGKSVLINTRNVLNEIDTIKQDLKNLDDKVSDLEKEVNNLSSTINGMSGTLNSINNTVNNLNSKISNLEKEIDNLR